MKRSQWIALAVLVAFALGVGYLATRNRQAPLLPLDEEHARGPDAQPCLACHDRDGVFPQSANHPLGDDCLRCHGIQKR